MKILVSIGLVFLTILLYVGTVFSQTGSPEEESQKRLSVREWERRGYDDGKRGSRIGLAATVAGSCSFGCCGSLTSANIVLWDSYEKRYRPTVRGGCIGGTAGCLSGNAIQLITAPKPLKMGLSPEEEKAYMHGFRRARTDAHSECILAAMVATLAATITACLLLATL